eukprot:3937856-Prymnesium_polylepis.2
MQTITTEAPPLLPPDERRCNSNVCPRSFALLHTCRTADWSHVEDATNMRRAFRLLAIRTRARLPGLLLLSEAQRQVQCVHDHAMQSARSDGSSGADHPQAARSSAPAG